MQMNIVKFCIYTIVFFSLSNCETIDKKVTETTEKENKILSKFLGTKSDVVKNQFGEPDIINFETPYKVYVYNKKNLLITCTREFYINPKTDSVEKFKSQNCIK